MADANVTFSPDAQYVILGELRASARLAARMNLSLWQWTFVDVAAVKEPLVYNRLEGEEVALLVVPGSGYPRKRNRGVTAKTFLLTRLSVGP